MLRSRFACLLLLLSCPALVLAQPGDQPAANPPAADIPRGTMSAAIPFESKIFPGTQRNYWVWVPKQYDPAKPTAFTIMQDGNGSARGWRLTETIEQLMVTGEVPVQIVIFIDHGKVNGADDSVQTRFNRSFEYDGMGDRYARFLIEEIIPEVKKSYNLSDDPNARAIGGASSGGIAAFNVAWERPDQFRRVISAIGTFVGLRGAHEFPTLIRKTEPKPLRVFLHDGSKDQNIYGGNWWLANQEMLSALEYAGYEVHHVWGEGGHETRQMASLMPEIQKFLWKDYPNPVKTRVMPAKRINIMIQDEEWRAVDVGDAVPTSLAADAKGSLLFLDRMSGRILRRSEAGMVESISKNLGAEADDNVNSSPDRIRMDPRLHTGNLAVGPDGKVYVCVGMKLLRLDADGKLDTVVDGVVGEDAIVLHDGTGFVFGRSLGDLIDGRGIKQVFQFDGKGNVAATEIRRDLSELGSLSVSPDHAFLNLASERGRFTLSSLIGADGKLSATQEFAWLHMPDDPLRHRAGGMAVDTIGNIYIATTLGVQVSDPLGRVNFIINPPAGAGLLKDVTFCGEKFDTLAVTDGEKVYFRKLKAQGSMPFAAPTKPPRPGL